MSDPSRCDNVPIIELKVVAEEYEPSNKSDSTFVLVAAHSQPGPGATATQEERRDSKAGMPGGQEHGVGPKGTGEKWEKSTGLASDGGDFDATRPGAGKENGDAALSSYGWRDPYGIADLSIGIGRQDKLFDLNLIVRNLFDERRGDEGWNSYTIYQRPRWIGVVISSNFNRARHMLLFKVLVDLR